MGCLFKTTTEEKIGKTFKPSISEGLVVEFESVVGISEILFRLIFHPDPIEKFGSIFLMFGVSRIVGLESLEVPDFFFLRGVGFVSR